MGIVGKIRKALKKPKGRALAAVFGGPVGSGVAAGHYLRRKFEMRTKIGRTIKGIYNPHYSPSSINSAGAAIPGHAGSSRSISSMM